MAYPGSSANPDSAALRNTLIEDWYLDIFVRVIVVHDQDLLGDIHITL
jgi:hypothetical protein